jgi:hypothetical protein
VSYGDILLTLFPVRSILPNELGGRCGRYRYELSPLANGFAAMSAIARSIGLYVDQSVVSQSVVSPITMIDSDSLVHPI